jgi:uncharacterized protein YjiK
MTRLVAIGLAILALAGLGAAQSGPYRIVNTVKAGGDGGFDYVYADAANRRLYIPRPGNPARVSVFDLDTLASVGEIPDTNARGVAVSAKSGHAFASSKPVAMWDAKTLTKIKTIDVDGGPDGIMYDAFNDRVWVLSHRAPNATVINASDGSIAGTLDLGGAPEQAASDGAGHVYIDLEDKDKIAVVDAKALTLTTTYDVAGSGGTCAGLAMDVKNRILFATCRNPRNMVVLSADTGKIITTLPIGAGSDGAVFNPATMEAFSSHTDGTLTVVKESSPTSFSVEQTVQTMPGAKTLTLDSKTNRIIVMSAQYGAPPANAPAGGRGPARGPMIPGSFTILAIGK